MKYTKRQASERFLTKKQEAVLSRQARNGDEGAIVTLVNSCRAMANQLIEKYKDYTDKEGLLKEANSALYRAAWKYDSDRASFSTVAHTYIENALIAYIRSLKIIRSDNARVISLDAPVDRIDGERSLLDTFSGMDGRDTQEMEGQETLELIRDKINKIKISEKSRYILSQVLLEERSQTELAEELGVSFQNIGQTYRAAAKQLQRSLSNLYNQCYRYKNAKRTKIYNKKRS